MLKFLLSSIRFRQIFSYSLIIIMSTLFFLITAFYDFDTAFVFFFSSIISLFMGVGAFFSFKFFHEILSAEDFDIVSIFLLILLGTIGLACFATPILLVLIELGVL